MRGIRILTVLDDSALSNQVNTYAQNVWNNIDHPRAEHIYSFNVNEAGGASLAAQMGINDFPAVVFGEVQPNGRDILTITAITGNTSEATIEWIYLQILNNEFIPGNGTDGSHTPVIIGTGEETSLGFGLGLFKNVPPNVWLFLAALGAYKSATAKNSTGMALWGAKGIGCTIQYIKTKNK